MKITTYKLKDITVFITDGKHGDCLNQDDSGFYFISSKDISDGNINYRNARQITENDFLETNKRTRFEPEDILLTNSGTIGRMAIAKNINETRRTTFQKSVAIIKPNKKRALPLWLYYYLISNIHILIDIASGAAQKNLLLKDIRAFKINVPEYELQKIIASILSAYDDLIDTNLRRISLLEESARLLFREWFVYFGFPEHEEVKIVDGMPEGWGRINFMDIISAIESGGRPKGGAVDVGIPSIGAENVNGIGNYNYSNEKYVPEEYYQKMKKGKVISRDVLLYKDGANIGRTSLVGYGYPHDKCCINEHVFILRTKNTIQNWLYFFLSQNFIQQAVANLNSNSAQPGISQDKLLSLKIIFPDEKIVRLFDDVTEGIVKQIFILSIQNQKLAQTRDLLLPRLMSGAIEV